MKRHPKVPGCKRLRGSNRNMFRQGPFTVVFLQVSTGPTWILLYTARIQAVARIQVIARIQAMASTIDELRFRPWP